MKEYTQCNIYLVNLHPVSGTRHHVELHEMTCHLIFEVVDPPVWMDHRRNKQYHY